MVYHIVSTKAKYRGLCRTLSIYDFPFNKLDALLPLYYQYIEIESASNNILEEYMDLLFQFRIAGVHCELIVCDLSPIDFNNSEKYDFLGIDVVCEMAESLLSDSNCIRDAVKQRLNSHGLCSTPNDVGFVVENSDHGNVCWQPCWVYTRIVE